MEFPVTARVDGVWRVERALRLTSRMLDGDAYGMLAWHLVAKAIEERAALHR